MPSSTASHASRVNARRGPVAVRQGDHVGVQATGEVVADDREDHHRRYGPADRYAGQITHITRSARHRQPRPRRLSSARNRQGYAGALSCRPRACRATADIAASRTCYPSRNRVTSAASVSRAARVPASSGRERCELDLAARDVPGRHGPAAGQRERPEQPVDCDDVPVRADDRSGKPSRAAADQMRPAAAAAAAWPPHAAGSPAARPGRPLAAPRRSGPGRAGHPAARRPPTGRGRGPPPGAYPAR